MPLNKRYRTPNMERLAREGMKFTNAYARSYHERPTLCTKYYDEELNSIEAKYASLIEGMDKSLGENTDF